MAKAGVSLRIDWNQLYQGQAQGDGDKTSQYGGQVDALLRLDLSKMGLWNGLSVTTQATYNYGHDVNNRGGSLIPVNAAMYFPGDKGSDRFDIMALYLSQAFGDKVTLNVGKLSLVEFSRATPLRGGGGIDTFWNLNLATPASGLSPPTIFGAMLQVRSQPVNYAFFVFDAADATNRNVFDAPFKTGVNFMATATYQTSIAGRTGTYAVKGIYSTQKGLNFQNLDQLVLPPAARNLTFKKGSWYVGLSGQQYIYQDPTDPARGWGVFGEITTADGNPNTLQWSGYLGLAGSGLIPSRPADRFGVAVFRYGASRDLKRELAPVFKLDDEAGAEAFYNFAATPWLRITADIQYVDPASGAFPPNVFAGVGTNVRF